MGQVREIASRHGELEDRGIRLVLVSPQPAARTRKLATETGLSSAFKVDRGNAAAGELGIADEGGVLPTVIVINARGTILYSDQTDNYRVRPEPDIYLSILKRAGAMSSA
jgi:peroxiredoxin